MRRIPVSPDNALDVEVAVNAQIAQLVEHFIGNEEVVGSNPILGSKCKAAYKPAINKNI